MDRAAAQALVAAIDPRLDETPHCSMCLYEVSRALREGDRRKLRAALRYFVPLLWDETLEAPVRQVLRRAGAAGIPGAAAALADVEERADRSPLVEEVVLHLARQQVEEIEGSYITSMN
jgi:hypothetical protein